MPDRIARRSARRVTVKLTHYQPPIELSADGAAAYIPLRVIDGSVCAYATVDATDVEWVSQWAWRLHSTGYAGRYRGKNLILLHRELLGLPRKSDGREGDHIDLDKLNDQRSNLRIIPKGCQVQNQPSHAGSSSQYRGVSWDKRDQRWRVAVKINGKNTRLGSFINEDEAGAVARAARLKLMPYAMD